MMVSMYPIRFAPGRLLSEDSQIGLPIIIKFIIVQAPNFGGLGDLF